ncbi:alpha/beta fold hydrolase [bacterium]|nr:alpha/beta fold hydrolase [bacterium]
MREMMLRLRGGHAMHVRDSGASDAVGLPILFIHGLGASGQDWEYQWPAFAGAHRLISPDLRGHGNSRARRPWGIAAQAQDMLALLDELSIERCIVVGHSMGGAIAQSLALTAPQRIERLVISNSLPSFRLNTAHRFRQAMMRVAVVAAVGVRPLASMISERLFPHPHQGDLRQRMTTRYGALPRWVYLQSLRALASWSVVTRLSELTMPVLLVGAEHDYFPPADTERFAAALPNCRLHWMAGSRHATPVDAAPEFNALVRQFIADSGA